MTKLTEPWSSVLKQHMQDIDIQQADGWEIESIGEIQYDQWRTAFDNFWIKRGVDPNLDDYGRPRRHQRPQFNNHVKSTSN